MRALSIRTKVIIGILTVCMAGLLLLAAIPLPVSVAEKLVSEHPGYFLKNESEWKAENSLPTVLWVKLLEFKLRHDIKEINLERLQVSSEKPAEAIHLVVEDVRKNYVSKLQARVPVITNSTFGSIVRGYGFCDHTNAFVAFMLTDVLDDVAMVGLSDAERPPHSVVRIKSSLGTVYADAFTCTNVFAFEEELSREGQKYIPTYRQLEEFLYPPVSYHQGREFNRYNTAYTVNKAFHRLGQLAYNSEEHPEEAVALQPASRKASVLSKSETEDSIAYARHALEPRDLQVLFLKARMNHLYNRPEQAQAYYRQVVDQAPEGSYLANYARIFLARYAGTDQLCSSAFNYNKYFIEE